MIRKLMMFDLIRHSSLLTVGITIQAVIFSAIALSAPTRAQIPPIPPTSPDEPFLTEAEAIQGIPPTATVIELTLPDLINIVIQGNRDLRNAVLERVAQRQVLDQEESRFDPQFTPDF
ncbi:MAG: hypothetical protein MJA27_27100, partial [Pseudanabaenales cyanobacterium]|nr:hypothetical protein [Pseudanabaenales cyanobacterium]